MTPYISGWSTLRSGHLGRYFLFLLKWACRFMYGAIFLKEDIISIPTIKGDELWNQIPVNSSTRLLTLPVTIMCWCLNVVKNSRTSRLKVYTLSLTDIIRVTWLAFLSDPFFCYNHHPNLQHPHGIRQWDFTSGKTYNSNLQNKQWTSYITIREPLVHV